MKRRIAILLLVAMAVVLVFSACGEKHVFGEWIEETPATCEASGVKGHYHCSHCDKNFTVEKVEISDDDLIIPATGHTEITDAAVAPTCTATGLTEGKHCSVCDKVLVEQVSVPAAGHIPDDIGYPETFATCTEDGSGYYICTVCGEKCHFFVIPTKGHRYGEWIDEVPATYTESGVKGHYHCDACGKNFDAEKAELADLSIPPMDHTYGELNAAVEATCEKAGMKAHYVCSCHGNFYDESFNEVTEESLVIPATGHTYGTMVAAAATCGQDGAVEHCDCSVCHKHFDADHNELDDIVIPATGAHTYGEWIDEVPPTKTEEGVKGHYHCDGCDKNFDAEYNELESLYIPALQDAGWSIVV